MQCTLSPPPGGARTVAQRLKESSLKESPSGSTPSTSDGRNGQSKPHPALNRRQQNTIRLIAQYLRDLGLHESVESLVEESGCKVENARAVRLREAIMRGHWNEALSVLEKSYQFLSPHELETAKLIILEEKFFELLSKGENTLAMKLMREEYPNKRSLRTRRTELVGMLFADANELGKHPEIKKFDSRDAHWRRRLAIRVQKQLDPAYMLPCKRLEQLTDQAFKYQVGKCRLHFDGDHVKMADDSIFRNHDCTEANKPLFKAHQILKKHTSEIYVVEFSPDGSKVASGSKNGEVIIWQVDQRSRKLGDPVLIRHNMDLHADDDLDRTAASDVFCISWSHDSRFVAVNGQDRNRDGDAWVYCTDNNCLPFRKIRGSPSQNCPPYTALAFTKNGKHQIIAGNRHGQLHFLDLSLPEMGQCVWVNDGIRINWIHTLRDSVESLLADCQNKIRQFDFHTRQMKVLITEESAILSIAVHANERYALLATQSNGLRLWDLHTSTLMRSFVGADYGRKIVQPSWGGPGDAYFSCGAQDGTLSMWSADSAKPVAKLDDIHRGVVNSVRWSPCDTAMMISVGDDKHLRVFTANLVHCADSRRARPQRAAHLSANGVGGHRSTPIPQLDSGHKKKPVNQLDYLRLQAVARARGLIFSNPGYAI